MSLSALSGPSLIYGELASGTGGSNPHAGPSITYQGGCLPDVRFPYAPGVTGRGTIRAFLDSPYVASVDAVPTTASQTAIVNAAVTPAADGVTAVTLVAANSASSTATGIGVNFPIIPAGSGYTAANVVKAVALDPGFVSCTLTGTNSNQLTVSAANLALFPRLRAGLTVLVGVNAGTAWTPATILTVAGTTVTLDSIVTGSSSAVAVIALANGAFRSDQSPLAVTPYLTAGSGAIFDARSGLARGVSVTTTGVNAAGTATVSGYDIYGYPMSETIACATASTFYGNKCFKYITKVVCQKTGNGALTGNLSIGTSDLFGFATRTDAYEYANIFWNGSFSATSAGWFAADTTTPATTATKDVRGSVQAGTLGPNGSSMTGSSNSTRRLQLFMSLPIDNLVMGTPSNPVPMFGVTQV